MNIAEFETADTQGVIELYTRVFSDSEGEAEGLVIGDLVAKLIATTAPDDLTGFVASRDKEILGCIFFSRLKVPNGSRAFLLSPVAIATNTQHQGVGQQLIRDGLDYLKAVGVELVFTYGDPNYYSQVGFAQIDESVVKAPFVLSQPIGWLAQSLDGKPVPKMQGYTECVPAFCDQKYW
jgi:predicted N-acetyltransferase YhbS